MSSHALAANTMGMAQLGYCVGSPILTVMASHSDLDAIVVGGGHNGLTRAAYLGIGRIARARF